ncbi:hypothetical protein [Flavobacterium aciduliphilum]|uniref:Conjugative transposon protein TraO n=1 Tax=Flavobacterium aciduliphilum TaxID=1101402 RepID=A0A328YN57_9FLAO|nr:hypothetical protein [Flavobacterium aciduliphilum]RAR75528.1 hypothetical protein CLV55_101228 [Flavobacterium aciduliphilum]
MKRLIMLALLVLGTYANAQEITLTKGKFYVDGAQISTRDTKKMLQSNYKAFRMLQSGISKESTGGFLLGFGGALIVTDLVVGLVSDVHYPTAATYIGAGSLLISIPVLSGKNKKIKNAIDLYNNGLKSNSTINSDVEVSFIGNQRGYGLQIRF